MNLNDLGQRIRVQREKCRLKQGDIARALGITAQAVSKWERGENAPDIAVLVDLAKLLNVTTDWLLGRGEALDSTFSASVLCTDLSGFAARAAEIPPRDLACWANGIFAQVTDAALHYDGVPVKYIGDGFLSFFSGPKHADRAAKAAIHVKALTANPALGVAVHSGEVYLGPVGHPEYARPDILGETVNIAFLVLHWVAGHTKSRVGITESTAALLQERPKLAKPKKVDLKPMRASIQVYEALS
ncbi:MAG: helix-turn-helix domain-containing protein [Planctomycetota bacterium]|nr:helix-turn-helix domain-containing protein [Planctomycetota bacterium]